MSGTAERLRKMARSPTSSSALWLGRRREMRADLSAAEALMHLHHDRTKLHDSLLHVDGRTYEAKAIVVKINALTVQINEATKELMP